MEEHQIKTVALIGLGAMGSFFAPRLSRTLGDNFCVIAGGERGERLRRDGVVIGGKAYHFPVKAPESGRPTDLIIIAVKGYSLTQAIDDIKYFVGENTLILPVLNGVTSERVVAEAYGEKKVLWSYMRVSVVMKDGVSNYDPSETDPAKGAVHFGEATNNRNAYSKRVLAVKELFERCRVPYLIDKDMRYGIWFKFACNVGENMTCALLSIPFGVLCESRDADLFRKGGMNEVKQIAEREGVFLKSEDLERQIEVLRTIPYDNKPSTLQDLEAKKRTEIELFAGEMLRLGEKYRVPTPFCKIFYHGIRVHEGQYRELDT